MSPKKIWGIVFIVLGVVGIIGGFSRYHNTAFYGKEILTMNAAVAGEVKKLGMGNFFNADYEGLIRREKFISVISIILGISFSIFGTFMIKDETPRPAIDTEEDEETEPLDGHRFKL